MKNIYKIIFLCLLTSVFCPLSSFSQTAPGIEWAKCYGGTHGESAHSICPTSDGGYVAAGTTRSNDFDVTGNHDTTGFYEDLWIIKIDSVGNLQWQNCLGGSDTEIGFYSIEQTSDGGYITVGWTKSNDGDITVNYGLFDLWVVKLYSNGNLQWQKSLGGIGHDHGESIHQTIDGGYIIGGYRVNPGAWEDYWIVKIDSIGNFQWEKFLGGSESDYARSIDQTSDKGYIVSGYTFSNDGDVTGNHDPNGDYLDFWIVKLDSIGNLQWQKCLGGTDDDLSQSVRQTSDGGYITAGATYSSDGDVTGYHGSSDFWIVKLDSSGNLQWQKCLGGSGHEEAYSVIQTSDGCYLAAGFNSSNYLLIKLDPSGNLLWQKTMGGTASDEAYSVRQTSDGGYCVAGETASNNGDVSGNHSATFNDFWIVKLYPDTITSIFNIQHSTFNLQFSPNPVTTQCKLTFNNLNKEKFLFTLYDITGRCVSGDSPLERGQGCVLTTTSNEIILTKGSKQPGVYLFNLMNEKNGERWNGKIVVSN